MSKRLGHSKLGEKKYPTAFGTACPVYLTLAFTARDVWISRADEGDIFWDKQVIFLSSEA